MATPAASLPPATPSLDAHTLQRIRLLLGLFITGLVLSGLTAFPLRGELALMQQWLSAAGVAQSAPSLYAWITYVHDGLVYSQQHYPFLAYGTDWLGFAHLVIATAFWGPYRDPVRNRWVIQWGMLSCGLVFPLALICGPLRGIPFFWRLIDCSFGLLGVIPLAIANTLIARAVHATGMRPRTVTR